MNDAQRPVTRREARIAADQAALNAQAAQSAAQAPVEQAYPQAAYAPRPGALTGTPLPPAQTPGGPQTLGGPQVGSQGRSRPAPATLPATLNDVVSGGGGPSRATHRHSRAAQDQLPGAVQDQLPGAVQDQLPGAVQDQLPGAVQDQLAYRSAAAVTHPHNDEMSDPRSIAESLRTVVPTRPSYAPQEQQQQPLVANQVRPAPVVPPRGFAPTSQPMQEMRQSVPAPAVSNSSPNGVSWVAAPVGEIDLEAGPADITMTSMPVAPAVPDAGFGVDVYQAYPQDAYAPTPYAQGAYDVEPQLEVSGAYASDPYGVVAQENGSPAHEGGTPPFQYAAVATPYLDDSYDSGPPTMERQLDLAEGAAAYAAEEVDFDTRSRRQDDFPDLNGHFDAEYAPTEVNELNPMGLAPEGTAAFPVQSAPMQSAPMQSAPMQSAPMQSAPMQSAPIQRVSTRAGVAEQSDFAANGQWGGEGAGASPFPPTATGVGVTDAGESPGSFDDIFAPVGGMKTPKKSGSKELAGAGAGRRTGGDVGRGIIGVLGEMLITVGVFLLLFVVWQMVWTDYLALGDQKTIIKTVEEGGGWVKSPAQYGTKHTEEPPVIAPPNLYDHWGMMYVPRFGEDYQRTITEGSDRKTILNPFGIGHYEKTVLPGQVGNFSLAGHRTTYGKPFNLAADLKVGDPLIIEAGDAWYVYYVSDTAIINPSQGEVINPVPNDKTGAEQPTERFITLTTCHPMYSAAERYVVWGKLEYWTPKAEGFPPDLPEASWVLQ